MTLLLLYSEQINDATSISDAPRERRVSLHCFLKREDSTDGAAGVRAVPQRKRAAVDGTDTTTTTTVTRCNDAFLGWDDETDGITIDSSEATSSEEQPLFDEASWFEDCTLSRSGSTV